MNLFFISDAAVLKFFLENEGPLDSKRIFFSWDTEVCFYLQEHNFQYINGWDLIGKDEIIENWELAHLLASSWLDGGKRLNRFIDINSYSCAEQDLVYPFQAALNADKIFKALVNTYQVKGLSGIANMPVAVIRTGPSPAHIATNSVAEAVFLYNCDKNGISVSLVRRSITLPNPVPTNYKGLNKLPTQKFFSGKLKYDHLALVYRDSMPFDEYYQLINSINAKEGWRSFTLTRDSLLDSLIGSHEYHAVLEDIDGAESQWRIYRSDICSNYPAIFDNLYLNFQFDKIKSELAVSILAAIKFDEILIESRAKTIYFGHDAFTFEKALCRVANRRGVSTIALIHGGAGYKFGYRGLVGDSSKIYIWNSIDYDSLSDYGVNSIRMQLNRPFRDVATRVTNDLDIGRKQTNSRPLVCIATTAINCGLAAPVADSSGHIAAINDLCRIIEDNPGVDFTIRAHPNYDYHFIYHSLYQRRYPNLLNITDKATTEVIGHSKLCLMLNYYSSVAMECFKQNVPVVYYKKSIYEDSNWAPCYEAMPIKISTAENYEGLRSLVDQLLRDNIFRAKCVEDGRVILKQLFPDVDNVGIHNLICKKEQLTANLTLKNQVDVKDDLYRVRLLGVYWYKGAITSTRNFLPNPFGSNWGENFVKPDFIRAYIFGSLQSNQITSRSTILSIIIFLFFHPFISNISSIRRSAFDYLVLAYGKILKKLISRLRLYKFM